MNDGSEWDGFFESASSESAGTDSHITAFGGESWSLDEGTPDPQSTVDSEAGVGWDVVGAYSDEWIVGAPYDTDSSQWAWSDSAPWDDPSPAPFADSYDLPSPSNASMELELLLGDHHEDRSPTADTTILSLDAGQDVFESLIGQDARDSTELTDETSQLSVDTFEISSDYEQQLEWLREEDTEERFGLPWDPHYMTSDEALVDMRDVGRGGDTNALDYPRDYVAYWADVLFNDLDRADDDRILSDENRDRVIALICGEPGAQAPRVDQLWIDHHPATREYENDKLVHHHWDAGPIAFAIPEAVHFDNYSDLHWLVLPGDGH
jgi:hypothetical protein